MGQRSLIFAAGDRPRRPRSWLALIGVVLGLAGCHATQREAPGAGRVATVVIAHVNDTHGRYQSFHVAPGNATAQTGDPGRAPQSFSRSGRVGGYAELATAVQALRDKHGAGRVLLLHAGDTFSDDLLGNLTKGAATIELMNALGFDFLALGNHDFDYGVERTRELQALARFPMRAANVLDANGQPFLGEPARIFTRDGIRVAVLALGYHNTPETGSRRNVQGLRFGSGIDAARTWVPRLREQADAVVVLSHQGSKVDRELARAVPGIDVIIGGHSHDLISPPERVGTTWLVQALSDAALVGQLQLRFEDRRLAAVAGSVQGLWVDDIRPDPRIEARVRQLRAPHAAALDAPVATAAQRIGRRYKSESPFDVMVGDILREHTGAEIAMLPGVGYGVSLEPGVVTREQLTALLPHPSKIATVTLTGDQVLQVLEQTGRNQKPERALDAVGGLLQTAGMRWTLDLSRPAGERARDVTVGGRPLQPQRSYRVVTNESMLQGLHRYRVLGEGRDPRVLDEGVAEVVESALRRRGTLHAPPAGNVVLHGAGGGS